MGVTGYSREITAVSLDLASRPAGANITTPPEYRRRGESAEASHISITTADPAKRYGLAVYASYAVIQLFFSPYSLEFSANL